MIYWEYAEYQQEIIVPHLCKTQVLTIKSNDNEKP